MKPPRIRGAVLALLGVLVLTGCAGLTAEQKRAVGAFSRSAVVVGRTTADELPLLRQSAIEMNAARYGLVGRESQLDFRNLDQQFSLANVRTVVRAATALQAYGELLLALVEDTQESELMGAAAGFVDGARGLPGLALTDEQASAIQIAVEQVGRFVVERRKKRAVETVVASARTAVDRICDLLADEFDPAKARLGAQYVNITSPLRAEASNVLQSATSPTERALALSAYLTARAGEVRHREVLQRISTTAAKLKEAHAALVEALARDRLGRADLQEAVALGKAVAESQAVARLAGELVESVRALR